MDDGIKTEDLPAVLQRIEKAFNNQKFSSQNDSLNFLRRFVTKIGADRVKTTRSKLLKTTLKKVSKVKPGIMYLFNYDPKYKDTLPVWDAYPLVFILDLYDDGFLGLNLHHVPPVIRQKVFIAFMRSAIKSNNNKVKRLKMDYDISRSMVNHAIIGKMIKRYLWKQMKSMPVVIPSELWDKVLFLPIAEMHYNT